MTRHLPRPARAGVLAPALILLLLVAALVAGCGGDSNASRGDGGADPASIAPPGSALFFSLDVNPQGTTKANVEAVGGALLNTDDFPGELQRLLSKSSKSHATGDLDFQRDVKPWLGDRLAIALPSFTSGGDPLLIAATKDDDQAREALGRAVKAPADATYHGVDYQHSADGKRAATVIDHLAVFGAETDVKRTIDASKGTALGATEGYRRATDKLPGDALATGYLDLRSVIDGAGKAAGQGAASGMFRSILGKNVGGVGLGAYADGDAVRLEIAVPGTGALGGSVTGADAAQALAGAPATAWLGIGLGNVGKSLNGLLDGLSAGGGIGALGAQTLLGQAEAAIGLDIRKDLLAWMGSAQLFVSGTTRDSVGGALVVHSTDPAASRRAVQRLRAALPKLTRGGPVTAIDAGSRTGFSIPIGKTTRATIVVDGDTFVIAIGDGALREALTGGDRLGDDPGFKAIAAKLNDAKPVFYLDLDQVGDLVSSLGGKDAQGAADVLHRFTQLAAGGKADGDVSRATVVAGVKVR